LKAVVCTEPYRLDLVERTAPDFHDGEVLVRIRRVGLCGTDYHIYAGRQPFLSYPRVIGHELGGEVVQAPPGSPFRPGQTVAINPYLSCGTCIACRKGKPNACTQIQVLGVHADGGMCELLSVPERAVIDATGLSFDQAAMIEFLAVGAHAVARAALRPQSRVAVVGAGPIGIGVAIFARLDGAQVTLVDTRASRLEYASKMFGFGDTVIAGPELAQTLAERSEGEMFDVVFDATGVLAAMRESLSFVAHGGTLVLVGVAIGDLSFSDPEFHKRETTLLGSRNALDADFARVISAVRDGSIDTDLLQTHALTADELPQRLPELIRDADHVLKAVAAF